MARRVSAEPLPLDLDRALDDALLTRLAPEPLDEGRTNREVAAELVVSVRAVEANLTRVYAKLGVRSRAELAARFRG